MNTHITPARAGFILALLFAWSSADAQDQLLESARSKDHKTRERAMKELVGLGPDGCAPLASLLAEPDEVLRKRAAAALGELGEPCAVEPLIAALGDTNKHVRTVAAKSLGAFKDQRAVEPLMQVAAGPGQRSETQIAAIESLHAIGDPTPVVLLMHLVKRNDVDPGIKKAAIETLDAFIGQPMGFDNEKRMKWIEENHPEWLKLDTHVAVDKRIPGMWVFIAVGFVLGLFFLYRAWKSW